MATPGTPSLSTGSAAAEFMIGLTEAQILALPMSGAGWTNIVTQSDKTITVDMSLSGISTRGASHALAAALRYVRTGTESYRTKVVTALDTVRTWDYATNGNFQSYIRQMHGWCLAADLVDHRTQAWIDFVDLIRHEDLPGSTPWGGIFKAAHRSPNNHGSFARASLLACNLFLNDQNTLAPSGNPGGVDQDINYFRCFLGEPSFYGTHAANSPTAGAWGDFYPGVDGWNYGSTWMGPSSAADTWAPINQLTATTEKEGAFNQEVLRETTSYALDGNGRPIFGTSGQMYSYTAGSGVVAEAMLLAAAGYTAAWSWSNDAVKRWRAYLDRWTYPHTHPSVTGWIDPMLNHIYATTYPEVDTEGYSMTGTRWLAQDTTWLKP